jgi:hypothetical protein
VSAYNAQAFSKDSVKALEGALVYVMTPGLYMQEKVWTDSAGNFHFSLPKGVFDIYVYCDNYQQLVARAYHSDTNRISILNVLLVKADPSSHYDNTIRSASFRYRKKK